MNLLAGAYRKLWFARRKASVELRAGRVEEIVWDEHSWIVLDVGFAKSGTRSSGLGFGSDTPVELTYSDARTAIIEYAARSANPINFVVEAPLSIAFDANGNPVGRSFEKRGASTRYWYSGLAASISIASMHLIHAIASARSGQLVRLFEGFATFKPKGKSNHIADVEALRRVVKREQGEIIPPDRFAGNTDDNVQSLFKVMGIDAGVPPLLSPW